MAIITKTTSSYKELLSYAKKLRKLSLKFLKKKIPNEIRQLMEDGISPTQGGEWKPDYSQRYINQINKGKGRGFGRKTISPVNLKLTGKMHRSLRAKVKVTKGIITLEFKDAEKAQGHDKGLGHLPKRRLLPNDGEKLHSSIRLLILQIVKNVSKKLEKSASDI